MHFHLYPDAFTEEIKKTLKAKGNWSGEVESVRVNGERYEMELNIDAVHDDDGKISHFVGVFSTVEVAEGDVVDETVADIRTSPGLETRGVLTVEHPEVLDDDVLDVRELALILSERTNGLTVSTVAVHGVDVDIRSVALGGEAVVTNVDPGTLNLDLLDV